jgi:hypothetical protein
VLLDSVIIQDTCVVIQNPGFDADSWIPTYSYLKPNGWTIGPAGCTLNILPTSLGACLVVVVQNNNGPWGGMNSGHGNHYLALQNYHGNSGLGPSSVSQSVVGLVPGKRYTVSVRTALRPGSGSGAALNVSLTTNGTTLVNARVVPVSTNFTRCVIVSFGDPLLLLLL